MQALHTAATGMAAQELNVQVISNNIANLRTTGFKKQTAAFQDLIYQHIRRVGAQSSDQGTILPVGIDLGGGVKTVGTPRSMTQGTLSQTGNDLDLAITGNGAAAQPDLKATVRQGYVEKSNVNSVAEMGRMIDVSRTYAQIANLLQQQSDLHKNAINQLAEIPT